jgi:hypothetical protein
LEELEAMAMEDERWIQHAWTVHVYIQSYKQTLPGRFFEKVPIGVPGAMAIGDPCHELVFRRHGDAMVAHTQTLKMNDH